MDRLVRWIVMALIAGPPAAVVARILIFGVNSLSALLTPISGPYIAPVVGAIIAAISIRKRPILAGTGSDAYITALGTASKSAVSSPSVAFHKIVATIFTVGSGGSGGLGGPALHVGAGLHTLLNPVSQLLGSVDPRDERTTRIVGAAAVLGAVTKTPLAAGILAVEILHRSRIEYREVPPAILGGASGAAFFHWLGGKTTTLSTNSPDFASRTILATVIAALVAGGVGFLLTRILNGMYRLRRGFAPRSVTVVAGAAVTGLLAMLVGTEILGWGVAQSLTSHIGAQPMGLRGFGLLVGKVLGTAATVGTGGSGGVIGPALVMGTFTGNGVAAILGACVTSTSVTAMAAALAAISNVPVAAAVMMVELFGGAVAPYAFIGSAIGFQIARSGVAYFSLSEDD
ncbi:MAG: chloride channel protein [Bacillota bacterium]